jgi:hypothetical protein
MIGSTGRVGGLHGTLRLKFEARAFQQPHRAAALIFMIEIEFDQDGA